MPISGPSHSPKLTTYLFIDAGYLRRVFEEYSRHFFGGAPLPISYAAISRGFTKTFYFDCRVIAKEGESPVAFLAREHLQEVLFSHLRELRGWHILEGTLKGTRRVQQKEIDILIAVEMMAHTYRRNMDSVTFIAGDQDFRPLIDSVVRDGMFIELWYEKRSASKELLAAADARVHLDWERLHSLLMPEFQVANPMPTQQISVHQPNNFTPIEIGRHPKRPLAHLSLHGATYCLYRKETEDSPHFLSLTHRNIEVLKRVLDYDAPGYVWEKQITRTRQTD